MPGGISRRELVLSAAAAAALVACKGSKSTPSPSADAPPAEDFECPRCGQRHPWKEIGFAWPDATFALTVPDEEQDQLRSGKNEDVLVMRDRLHFVRGWAPVPIREGGSYGIGFWIQISKKDYQDYEQRRRGGHPAYSGRIANQVLLLAPALGVAAEMTHRRDDLRPALRLTDAAHPLAAAQRDGVPRSVVLDWMASGFHRDEPERKGEPFEGTLEKQGWMVLEPAEVGRAPAKPERPPSPGDSVKLAVRFIAAGEDGEAIGINAGWWVKLDDTSRPERWSGTLDNYPLVPATLARGSRLWFKPSQVMQVGGGG